MPNDNADFPIRGYEYYDLRHDVENVTLVNFQPNATRDAGALSYLMYASFGMSTENAIEGAKFINAKPVSFPQHVRRWAPDEEACEMKPAWGVAVCLGDFGTFSIAGNFGFGSDPIPDPVMLSRNGRRWEYTGQTTIRSGAEVRVETGRESLSLSLNQMEEGAFVIFELPGFSTAKAGTQDSLEALRGAGHNSYYLDRERNTLWVKVVSGRAAGASGPGSTNGVDVGR